VNQLVLNTAPRAAQAEGSGDLRLLTASRAHGTPLGALSGMLVKKRINAQRDWGFSSCQATILALALAPTPYPPLPLPIPTPLPYP